MGFGEAMKYLAERWKVMNDEMKYPYYQMAMKDQKRYDYEVNYPQKIQNS